MGFKAVVRRLRLLDLFGSSVLLSTLVGFQLLLVICLLVTGAFDAKDFSKRQLERLAALRHRSFAYAWGRVLPGPRLRENASEARPSDSKEEEHASFNDLGSHPGLAEGRL